MKGSISAFSLTQSKFMTKPDGDGWIPWPEDEHGRLRQPLKQLGGRKDDWGIESRYECDEGRLVRAWSRKIASETEGLEPI